MGNCLCSKVENRDENQTNNSIEIHFGSDIDSENENRSVPNTPDLSFEGGSVVSKLEHIYVGDETCAICSFGYDNDEHFPKILPCGHTICYYCIKQIARKNRFRFLDCPLDRKRHTLKEPLRGMV